MSFALCILPLAYLWRRIRTKRAAANSNSTNSGKSSGLFSAASKMLFQVPKIRTRSSKITETAFSNCWHRLNCIRQRPMNSKLEYPADGSRLIPAAIKMVLIRFSERFVKTENASRRKELRASGRNSKFDIQTVDSTVRNCKFQRIKLCL